MEKAETIEITENPEEIECRKLAQELNIRVSELDLYMCRGRFSHILKVKKNVHTCAKVYIGIRDEDIQELKEIISKKKRRKNGNR